MDVENILKLCNKIKRRIMQDEVMYSTAHPWLEMIDRYLDQAADIQDQEVFDILWDLKTAICYACAASELNAAIERAKENGDW